MIDLGDEPLGVAYPNSRPPHRFTGLKWLCWFSLIALLLNAYLLWKGGYSFDDLTGRSPEAVSSGFTTHPVTDCPQCGKDAWFVEEPEEEIYGPYIQCQDRNDCRLMLMARDKLTLMEMISSLATKLENTEEH